MEIFKINYTSCDLILAIPSSGFNISGSFKQQTRPRPPRLTPPQAWGWPLSLHYIIYPPHRMQCQPHGPRRKLRPRDGEGPGSLSRGEAGPARSLLPHPANFLLPTVSRALPEGGAEDRRAQGGLGTTRALWEAPPASRTGGWDSEGSSARTAHASSASLPARWFILPAALSLGHAGRVLAHASGADTLAWGATPSPPTAPNS